MQTPRKIYLAGPMTGLPDFNRPAFFRQAEQVAASGHIVLNPAVLPLGLAHHEYMAICLPMVEIADELLMLPGWEQSKGAKMEHSKAQDLGKPINYL